MKFGSSKDKKKASDNLDSLIFPGLSGTFSIMQLEFPYSLPIFTFQPHYWTGKREHPTSRSEIDLHLIF